MIIFKTVIQYKFNKHNKINLGLIVRNNDNFVVETQVEYDKYYFDVGEGKNPPGVFKLHIVEFVIFLCEYSCK